MFTWAHRFGLFPWPFLAKRGDPSVPKRWDPRHGAQLGSVVHEVLGGADLSARGDGVAGHRRGLVR